MKDRSNFLKAITALPVVGATACSGKRSLFSLKIYAEDEDSIFRKSSEETNPMEQRRRRPLGAGTWSKRLPTGLYHTNQALAFQNSV